MGERVTLELDSESMAAAKEAGIDLSALLIEALRRRLPKLHAAEREAAARQWYEENKEAVDAHNQFIAAHGLFSDGLRKI
jgi:antitoxin CcdA